MPWIKKSHSTSSLHHDKARWKSALYSTQAMETQNPNLNTSQAPTVAATTNPRQASPQAPSTGTTKATKATACPQSPTGATQAFPHSNKPSPATTTNAQTQARSPHPPHQAPTIPGNASPASPAAPRQTATAAGLLAPNTRKRKCTSSGTTVLTFARNGRRCERFSIASSRTVRDTASRVFSASFTASLRRRSVLRCGSRGACAMESSFARARLLRLLMVVVHLILALGGIPMFGTLGWGKGIRMWKVMGGNDSLGAAVADLWMTPKRDVSPNT